MDIPLDVYIEDGTDPDVDDLALTYAAGYKVTRSGLSVGRRTWKKETVESPYVHSRFVIGQKLDVQGGMLRLRVRGSNHGVLATRLATVITAMDQTYYTLRSDIDGTTYRWRCEAADSALGEDGVLDELGLMQLFQQITFTFPRHPVPLAGAF